MPHGKPSPHNPPSTWATFHQSKQASRLPRVTSPSPSQERAAFLGESHSSFPSEGLSLSNPGL